MNNHPAVFSFEGLKVRTLVRDGEPWFVAKDVAEILGYVKTRNAIKDHCKHAILFNGLESGRLTSSPRGITIIPERDLYRLVMRSKLPGAERRKSKSRLNFQIIYKATEKNLTSL